MFKSLTETFCSFISGGLGREDHDWGSILYYIFELRWRWPQGAEHPTKTNLNYIIYLPYLKKTQEAGQVHDWSRDSARSLRTSAFTSFTLALSLDHDSHRWTPQFQVSHEDTTASGQRIGPKCRFLSRRKPFLRKLTTDRSSSPSGQIGSRHFLAARETRKCQHFWPF